MRHLPPSSKTKTTPVSAAIIAVKGGAETMQDHTRIKDENRLKNEDRYYHILQAIPDAILLTHTGDNAVLDINEAFEKLTGYRRGEILGRTCDQLPFFPKPGFRTQAFQEPEATDEAREIETNIFRKDGRIACVLITSRPIKVAGDICRLNIIRDITGQKQAEALLWKSEQRMKKKLDALLSPENDTGKPELADVIDVSTLQSLMDDFNKLARIPMAIVDLEGRVLVGVGWQDICVKFHRVHPETCRHCVESDLHLSANLQPGEFRLYKCKNNMWDIATPLMVDGRHVGNIFSGQFFFDNEPLDYELFRSQARRYGFDEQAYMAALGAVQRLSRETVNTGMRFLMKLAHMISQLSYSNIKLVRSLTERDALMNSLQASEERYRNLVDGVPVGIFRTTADGNILDANAPLVHMLGYHDREALLASNAAGIYASPEGRKQWKVRADKEGIVRDFETQMQRPDGNLIWVRISGRVTRDDENRIQYYEGVLEDITERRQTAEALQKAQEELIRKGKLSILGQLAGVVGHELRNPLGVMSNAVYYLQMVLTEADETTREYLDIIKKEIDNSLRIITDLLDFARTKPPQTRTLAVRELIDGSLGKCTIPKSVAVRIDIPDPPPVVSVDLFQMEQVFQNIITNAVQAMPDGGELHISTRYVQGSTPDVQGSKGKTDEHQTSDMVPTPDFVEISIADTGEGISPENMEKLFQPLFTTKTKGIGLGLVVCKNLTEANGGRIAVKSRLGRGTSFILTLISSPPPCFFPLPWPDRERHPPF